jgi:hypothetical protein
MAYIKPVRGKKRCVSAALKERASNGLNKKAARQSWWPEAKNEKGALMVLPAEVHNK